MKVLDCVTTEVLGVRLEQESAGTGEKEPQNQTDKLIGRVPFSDTTNTPHKNMKESNLVIDMVKQTKSYEKENSSFAGSCGEQASPKPTLKLKIKDFNNQDFENEENNNCPDVPEPTAPLTPTANLKMLISAVSPEIRNRDKQSKRKELFKMVEEELEDEGIEKMASLEDPDEISSSQESEKGTGSRKEKSLGLLCQRFLSRFPMYPEAGQNIEICLDAVAKELKVERRRIYDIVNVLESVEMVSRVAKNKYTWHGKTNLHTTLAKLKALGDAEGFMEQIEKLKEYEVNREMNRLGTKPQEDALSFKSYIRKDKSLGIMSQRFLMLFLVSKPRTVNLDLSAKILIGDPNVDKTENAKFKTKIRRLYDIANILTSLDLIRKVHITEIRGRKPAFKYIGPEIENTVDMNVCSTVSFGLNRPSSRHSMLHCVQSKGQSKTVMDIMNSYRPLRPSDTQLYPNSLLQAESKSKTYLLKREGKRPFSRHASFDQICQVAEKERIKLFSNSQPSSPVKETNVQGEAESHPPANTSLLNSLSGDMLKGKNHVILMQGKNQFHILSNPSASEVSGNTAPSEESLSSNAKENPPASTATDSEPKLGSAMKPTTVVHLTRNQIDAVLRSLKVPVPVSSESKTDASTQSSPALLGLSSVINQNVLDRDRELCASPECTLQNSNEITPDNVWENSTGESSCQPVNTTPSESKTLAAPSKPLRRQNSETMSVRQEETTPRSPLEPGDAEVAAISHQGIKRRLSEGQKVPLRALHLQTEFRQSPPLAKLPKLSPEAVTKDLATDLDLASPLPDEDDGQAPNFTLQPKLTGPSTSDTIIPAVNTIKVKLQSQGPPTVMQVPLTASPSLKSRPSLSRQQNTTVIPVTFPSHFAQPVPVFQGVQVTQNGQLHGHPLNVVVPFTFTPPHTPTADGRFPPTVFAFPTVSPGNISAIQPLKTGGKSLIKTPVNTAICSIVTPGTTPTCNGQAQGLGKKLATPNSFFGNTPGAAIRNLSSQLKSPEGSATKVTRNQTNKPQDGTSATARRLDMPKPQ